MEFKLRPWQHADLKSLVTYANNNNIAKNLTDQFPHPYTEEDGRWFINYANQDDLNHIFAIEINGEAAGSIGIHQQTEMHRRNAELGYWLGEPFWSKGLTKEAIAAVIKFGFEQLQLTTIFLFLLDRNSDLKLLVHQV